MPLPLRPQQRKGRVHRISANCRPANCFPFGGDGSGFAAMRKPRHTLSNATSPLCQPPSGLRAKGAYQCGRKNQDPRTDVSPDLDRAVLAGTRAWGGTVTTGSTPPVKAGWFPCRTTSVQRHGFGVACLLARVMYGGQGGISWGRACQWTEGGGRGAGMSAPLLTSATCFLRPCTSQRGLGSATGRGKGWGRKSH